MIVEGVYALPDEQLIRQLDMPAGSVVRDAVLASGFVQQFEEVMVDETAVGIYGVRVSYTDELQDGDRVELYRSLLIDPMEARRARAKTQTRRGKTL